VIRGGRAVCDDAGIPLAGGHSIDTPEPIFGLAVTGVVNKRQMKRNDTATAGCLLYLTKPLGIGILTTAEKKGKLRTQDVGLARDWMCTLNKIGSQFAKLAGVTAMTDVTGFGLLGHLVEMADGSGLTAQIEYARVPHAWPRSSTTWTRVACRAAPCATMTVTRANCRRMQELHKRVLCDPQTSGGLLVAVTPEGEAEFLHMAASMAEP
jgi:selenide, water dikinase